MWDGGWLGYAFAFALYCVAGITDYLDGYLARAQGTVSKLGVFLDPIADKIMIAAVIVMLIAAPTDPITGWHVIAAMIILLREITVSGLREFRSEEHTSELQSLMRISYAVFCLLMKNKTEQPIISDRQNT